jgi:PAS domain S-box-containing protein
VLDTSSNVAQISTLSPVLCDIAVLTAALVIASLIGYVMAGSSIGRLSIVVFWILAVLALCFGCFQVLDTSLSTPLLHDLGGLTRVATTVLLWINALLLVILIRRRAYFLAFEAQLEEQSAARVRREELLQSESRCRSIFDNTRDVITCVDTHGRMIDVNRRVEEVFGYKPAELIGKRFTKLGILRLKDIPRMARLFRQTIWAGKAEEIVELELTHKNGGSVFVEVGTRFVRLNGKIKEIVNVFRDITERKRTMVELTSAKQAAEVASHAKSEFLANMSHELRTPMTAILGYVDVLLGNPTPETTMESARVIQRNGAQLLELINDILDLSKIEAGKCDVERVACAPYKVAADVISLIKVRAETKGLSLKLECQSAIPDRIRTDPARLRQILVNLIGNAVKFTEVGEVRVIIRGDSNANATPTLRFDIVDTGIGLSKEQTCMLFEPFSQADSSVNRRFGGSGLGLVISRRLAKILGGDIAVTSTLGKGSTFSVTIAAEPWHEAGLVDDLPAEAQPRFQAASSPMKRDSRVLLAEDSPDIQRLIAHMLRKAGADVVVAENGQQAVELALATCAEAKSFDVVLMDMQMPMTDGYEATCQLRQAGYRGPIIALTAHAMKEDRRKCLEVGCDDYVAKPIDHKRLVEMVAKYVQEPPNLQQTAAGEPAVGN